MTKLSVDEVLHIAKLAKLKLTDEEIKKLRGQLEETITFIDKLNEIDTIKVEPTNQVNHLVNVYRGDISGPSLSKDEILHQAKHTHGDYFVVDSVLNKE